PVVSTSSTAAVRSRRRPPPPARFGSFLRRQNNNRSTLALQLHPCCMGPAWLFRVRPRPSGSRSALAPVAPPPVAYTPTFHRRGASPAAAHKAPARAADGPFSC